MSQESPRSSVSLLCMSRLVSTARVPRTELYKQQHRHIRGDTARCEHLQSLQPRISRRIHACLSSAYRCA
jgi:hypothetical protein